MFGVGLPLFLAAGTAIQIVDYAETAGNGSTGDLTVNLPGGIQANDTIVLIGVTGGTPSSLTATGFTTADINNPSILYKMAATGSEGSTIVVNSGGGTHRGFLAILIRNADTTTALEISGRNASSNPPSISPSWGAAVDSLIIPTAILNSGAQVTSVTYPSGYTDSTRLMSKAYGGGNYGTVAVAAKIAKVSSDDPGSFSGFSANQSRTIALKGKS